MRPALPAAAGLLLLAISAADAQPAARPDRGSPEYAACLKRSRDVTPEVVACSLAETARWDRRLNAAYGALMRNPDRSAETKGLLREAQRAWITYRDRACAAEGQFVAEGGTLARIIEAECVLQLTAERAARLEETVRDAGQQ